MNQPWSWRSSAFCAVPVLPPTSKPSICALRAGAVLDHADHHLAQLVGDLGADRRAAAPSGRRCSSWSCGPGRAAAATRYGRICAPSLATAAAISAPCSGVIRTSRWPMRTGPAPAGRRCRPGSGSRRCWLAATGRPSSLVSRPTVRSSGSKPNACAVSLSLSAPSSTPSWAKPVLHESVSASLQGDLRLGADRRRRRCGSACRRSGRGVARAGRELGVWRVAVLAARPPRRSP